jgi:serine/threonine protein kinase
MASPEERLLDLLDRFQEAEAQGSPVSVDVLCADCPDLLEELRRQVELLKGLKALADCGDPSSLTDTEQARSQPAAAEVPAIPGYELLRELGRGGMGVVYLARQAGLDRQVALKVILSGQHADRQERERFRREAQAAARLSHPNVVGVYEADHVGDVHYLAMEYVPGITLQRLVETAGPLPIARACDFVRQTALGLQHAHEKGLVHRDIKPSNIMVVAPDGLPLPQRPVVKVLDMGVARLYQLRDLHEESLTTLTRDGAVIGTPDYIAPEQLEDPHAADIRADLYSLGCTLYFLLAGSVPFPGGTLIQKLDRQRWHTPPSVDQLRPEVPAGLARVVRRLMAKHPEDRYQEPRELAEALEQLARTGTLPGAQVPAPLRASLSLPGHAGPVTGLAFLADSRTLVSGGTDRSLRLWDLESGKERLRFGEAHHPVGCLAVLIGNRHVLAGQGVSLRLWDPDSGKELLRLGGHTDVVRAVAVSADGRFAASGGDDRTVRLWDLQRGREVWRLSGHRAGVIGVALSPDGKRILSAGREGTLRLWDAGTGRELRSFLVQRALVLCVGFMPDGQGVLSGHFDTTLRLWEAETARELRRFSGHWQMVGAVASAAGRVVSGSHDQTVRVWDPASGAELCCCAGATGPVLCVAVSAGGQVAAGGQDGVVRLWQVPG